MTNETYTSLMKINDYKILKTKHGYTGWSKKIDGKLLFVTDVTGLDIPEGLQDMAFVGLYDLSAFEETGTMDPTQHGEFLSIYALLHKY